MTLTRVTKDSELFVSHSGKEMGSVDGAMQILLGNGMMPAPLELMARAVTACIEEGYFSSRIARTVREGPGRLVKPGGITVDDLLEACTAMIESEESKRRNWESHSKYSLCGDILSRGTVGSNFLLYVARSNLVLYVPERPDIVVEQYLRFKELESEERPFHFSEERTKELIDIAHDEKRRRMPYKERSAVLITPDTYKTKNHILEFSLEKARRDPIFAATYRGSFDNYIEAILKYNEPWILVRGRRSPKRMKSIEMKLMLWIDYSFRRLFRECPDRPPRIHFITQSTLETVGGFTSKPRLYDILEGFDQTPYSDTRIIGQPAEGAVRQLVAELAGSEAK